MNKKRTNRRQYGPVYEVRLIDTLPLGRNDSLRQQMPNRQDLEEVRQVNERVAAGYEVLLHHYLKLLEKTDGIANTDG